jgi:mRNA interferase MazF
MSYNTWDIILVPFPFTNLKSVKKRPALIISPPSYNSGSDIIILFITSNIDSAKRPGDHLIDQWSESGLPKPSMIRMKFATIEKSIVVKQIGRLSKTDRSDLQQKLFSFFDLN